MNSLRRPAVLLSALAAAGLVGLLALVVRGVATDSWPSSSTILAAGLVVHVLCLGAVVVRFSATNLRGRDGLGTMGNGMGVMDNFFSPSRADAAEELERQKRAAHVMPSPDEDDELRHGQVRRNPDGSPRSIRLTRPPEDD